MKSIPLRPCRVFSSTHPDLWVSKPLHSTAAWFNYLGAQLEHTLVTCYLFSPIRKLTSKKFSRTGTPLPLVHYSQVNTQASPKDSVVPSNTLYILEVVMIFVVIFIRSCITTKWDSELGKHMGLKGLVLCSFSSRAVMYQLTPWRFNSFCVVTVVFSFISLFL